MLRFSRKSSAKDKQKKGRSTKLGRSKDKKDKYEIIPVEEDADSGNHLIGIQQCRKLLTSCPRQKSAKCVATFRRKSQLSKSLLEVLLDDSVLPYFMEYMQKQNATNLLNFWLTSETFRLATINRLRINSMSRLKQSRVESACGFPNQKLEVSSSSSASFGYSSRCLETGRDTNPRNSVDNSQNVDSSRDEFGNFTGFVPENNTTDFGGDVLLLCEKCGSVIIPSSSGSCKHCSLRNKESSDKTNLNLSSIKGLNSIESLPNGFSQSDCSCEGDSSDCELLNRNLVEGNSGTQKRNTSSKVTFDLTPDYEHQRREFCCRRTRSIVIDAVSIYSKYISLEASHPIGLEESIRQQIEINICSEDGKIHPDSFLPAQKFAFDVMERMYFPSFVGSAFHSKHQIDVLTSGKVFLSDIIYNETAMFYFMEYLEQEGVQHMLEFWLTADHFQLLLKTQLEKNEYNAEHALDDAMVIYEKYFSMQASLPLGVDGVTRTEIENKICREGGPLADCFSTPMEHVLCLLEEVFFPSFLQSEIYFKFLTELLNSVTERRQSLTDRGGRVEDVGGLRNQVDERTRLVTSFGSELDLSENPDAIWQRPNAGPLSLGRMNEFGVFEPIFEPDPDSGNGTSTAAKLGKAMRKLVSGGEDKGKEEMAWKIAKMIIEDVKKEQENPGGQDLTVGMLSSEDELDIGSAVKYTLKRHEHFEAPEMVNVRLASTRPSGNDADRS